MEFNTEVSIPIRVKVTTTARGEILDVEAFLPDGTPIYVESFGNEGREIFDIINELAEDAL